MNSLRMILKYWLKSRKDFIFQFTFLTLSTIFSTTTPIFVGRLVGGIIDARNLIFNFLPTVDYLLFFKLTC